MLVLSRKVGESIALFLPNGGKVEVTFTDYIGQQTMVGIEASQNNQILRSELLNYKNHSPNYSIFSKANGVFF